ncbi:SigE family RNA polymerase sigma factor [Kribbella italica]|uniref:RNA polymerase sigma-70 factor (Sigma-E family) n=1 Tax=Kribbella italica TaxID=1540520 RepID=A0A7W9MUQ4_9ACTN|nr:SigE family RNA polymerase sigma factor [Kribbella italica]MBB5836415.1 RNA polymerase sigma-70 factor (sigma-E family) [Kribbella italica]
MRGGDREAEFREYVLADRTRLLRTAMLLTAGDVHTAEDLVQTACTRVYVHWHRIRHEGAGPYAHRILVNAFLDERRRAGRHPEVMTADPLEPREPDVTDHADLMAVRSALLDLAPRQRAVLVLRYFQDLDVATCARILECTEGTVKSQTAKALKRLKDLMADDQASGPATGSS